MTKASPALIATEVGRAQLAWQLGGIADRLVGEEPLPALERAAEALRQQAGPERIEALEVAEGRLLRLAAGASRKAALSSRLELYPQGLAAEKALGLSLGSLIGARYLTVEKIKERVHGRYPDAAPLPPRPELDRLLEAAGAELIWRDAGAEGAGYYPRREIILPVASTLGTRHDTTDAAPEPSAEILVARELEGKLKHAHRSGGYLIITVEPRQMLRAESELLRRFPRTRINLDKTLIGAMRGRAEGLAVSWPKVLEADATPRDGRDFKRLLELVRRAAPEVEAEIAGLRQPALLVHPGLLARYELVGLIDKLRTMAGTRQGPPSLWILVPQVSSGLPMLDGHPVPVLSSAEWLRLNESWLVNAHRAGTSAAA